jgi:hypothetical protein
MPETRHGWIKWVDEGSGEKVPTHVVGKITDDFIAPAREALDYRNVGDWPIGLDGKPEDPWRKVVYLPLVSVDGQEHVTFTTSTPTGLSRFWKLVDQYGRQGRFRPGDYPIIEISTGSYQDKRYGRIEVPSFRIVDWARPDEALLQLGHQEGDGGSEMDDPDPPLDAYDEDFR